MRIPRATWFSGAAIVFLAGMLSNSADLLFTAGAVLAAGLVGEVVYALRIHRAEQSAPRDLHLQSLEERLLMAETALSSAAHEITTLKREQQMSGR